MRWIETEADVARAVLALRQACPVMRRIHETAGDPPLRRRAAGFEGLARIIVGQQVSVASANAIWARFAASVAPMTAETLVRHDDDVLRGCGLSRPKIRALRALADAVSVGRLDIEALVHASDEAVHTALTAVSGIGPWTADIYIMFCLGRADAFAPGDLALQIAAQHAAGLPQRPNDKQLEALAETWRPWRAVAACMLWAYYPSIGKPAVTAPSSASPL